MAVRGLNGSDSGREPNGVKSRADSTARLESQSSATTTKAHEGVVVSASVGLSGAREVNREAQLAERIAEARAQIRAGTYKIDPEKLAERLLDEELARAGRKS